MTNRLTSLDNSAQNLTYPIALDTEANNSIFRTNASDTTALHCFETNRNRKLRRIYLLQQMIDQNLTYFKVLTNY